MFESRRKVLLRRLQWLVIAPLGALILTGLILGAEWLAIESDAIGIDGSLIEAGQKAANAALTAAGLDGYAVPRWVLIAVIAYPFALILWSRKPAEALRDRFFPVYDDSRFRRVTRMMPEIGAELTMPWAKGSKLDAIATDLIKSLRDPTHLGDDASPWHSPWHRPKPPLPFDHFVVAGRPGAGKSRLVHRVARELGRRDVLGNAGREKPGNEPAAIALERGESSRRRWWFRARWTQDPWDSGILPHVLPESFGSWRPARPTLLWLDDPAAERAEEWINRLREFSSNYRFAVRLAIVGQSALDGLPLSRQLPPITLARHSYFTETDLATLTRSVGLHHIGPATNQRIHELTEGNPLLVELALDFLRRGKPVSELSEDAIIAERIGRIRQALDNAHADFRLSGGKHAVALGTLAGPDCPIRAVLEHFPGISLSRESLAAAFPSEAQRGVDLAQVMPSVRPLMIGDAFVRSIAAERADLAGRFAAGTFSQGPDVFLPALERVARIRGPLADALCDPVLWQADWPAETRLRYHQALMGLALRGCRDGSDVASQIAVQLDSLPEAERFAAEDQLYAWIEGQCAALTKRIAASDRAWHAALAQGKTPAEARREQDLEALEPPAYQFYDGRSLAIFWSMLAARSIGRTPVLAWDRPFVDSRQALIERYYGLLCELDIEALREADVVDYWQQLLPAPPDADRLDLFAINIEIAKGIPAGLERNFNLSGSIRKALATASWPEGSAVATLLGLQRIIDFGDDPVEMLGLIRQAESLAEEIRADETSSFRAFVGPVVLFGWAVLARVAVPTDETLQRIAFWIDDIKLARFPEIIPGLGLTAVGLALKLLAESPHSSVEQRRALIDQIREIIALLKARELDHRPVQDGLLGALKQRCYDLLTDPDACLAQVQEMEALAAANGRMDSAAICAELLIAWRYYTYAQRNNPTRYSEGLAKVEAITMRPRFAGMIDMRAEAAKAYSYGVIAYVEQPAQAEIHFWRMHELASHPDLSGPGESQMERVDATENIAKIYHNDPARFAEFQKLLSDFVNNVNPGWHQYAAFQAAVQRLHQLRPFTSTTLA